MTHFKNQQSHSNILKSMLNLAFHTPTPKKKVQPIKSLHSVIDDFIKGIGQDISRNRK